MITLSKLFPKLFLGDEVDLLSWVRMNRNEWLMALLAFVSVLAMYMINPWQHLHPQVWGDVSSALAIKEGIVPEQGLWRYFVGVIVRLMPDSLPYVLHLIGALSGAFCAAVMYLLLSALFPLMFRHYTTEILRIRFLVDLLLMGLVWMLALSEGIWNIFRFFTVQTSFLLFVMVVVLSQIMFLMTTHLRWLLVCYLTTGILAGVSPIGLFMLLVVQFVFTMVKRRWCSPQFDPSEVRFDVGAKLALANLQRRMPLLNPLIVERIKTPCAVAFVGGFLISTAADLCFAHNLTGMPFDSVLRDSVLAYLAELASYANALDFVKVALLVGFPLVANLWFCRQATDTEKFLPRYLSCLYLITALVAYTQLSGVSKLWFWTWPGSPLMPSSPLFLAIVSFCAILVVATSLVVFVIDACCRDFTRLVQNLCPDSDSFQQEADAVLGHAFAVGTHRIARLKGLGFLCLVLVLCALSVPSRGQGPQRAVLGAIYEFVAEVAREASRCGGFVATNGALDDAISLCLHKVDPSVKVISAKAAHGLEGQTAEQIAWMTDLTQCYFTGGWDFSGVVARRSVDKREAVENRRRVRDLAERFVSLVRNGTLSNTPDRFLRNAFDVVSWHLARMLNMQLQTVDDELSAAEVKDLERLVRELDRGNAALKEVLAKVDSSETKSNVVLTPLEGLTIAINRSDLELARRYVDIVLEADSNNVLALYARGMLLLKDGRPVRAAEVLKLVAEKWPEEPAVLNNLAVALSRAGQREEARGWIRKAQALAQGHAAIRANATEILGSE